MQPTMAYICLLAAIVFEVSGTLLSIVVNVIPIAIMYATWSGLGIFTLALVSYFAFNQSLNFLSVIGLALIVIGVVLVNMNIILPK